MKKTLITLAVSLLLVCFSTGAYADVIDFNLDTGGYKPNGWQSNSSSFVSFYDTMGSDLRLGIWEETNYSMGLTVWSDDASKLKMVFATQVNNLALDFGNDEPGYPVDAAVLELYLSNVLVGTATMATNNNNLMDQTISYSGNNFDTAIFYYAYQGAAANLIEAVDNITFNTQVPEPATMLLFGAGLAGLGLMRKRFKG